MAELVYLATHGPDDPTKACMLIHLAVNDAAEAGIEAEVNLAGDAVVLIHDAIIDAVLPIGFPPLKDLLAKAREKDVHVFIMRWLRACPWGQRRRSRRQERLLLDANRVRTMLRRSHQRPSVLACGDPGGA
ncbi:MAG TPA: hypothetical protein VGR22_00305, partial [Thermomicrobiales bacterium]|nr:hypothetical protein [Thermomicrobiales bacterium]